MIVFRPVSKKGGEELKNNPKNWLNFKKLNRIVHSNFVYRRSKQLFLIKKITNDEWMKKWKHQFMFHFKEIDSISLLIEGERNWSTSLNLINQKRWHNVAQVPVEGSGTEWNEKWERRVVELIFRFNLYPILFLFCRSRNLILLNKLKFFHLCVTCKNDVKWQLWTLT